MRSRRKLSAHENKIRSNTCIRQKRRPAKSLFHDLLYQPSTLSSTGKETWKYLYSRSDIGNIAHNAKDTAEHCEWIYPFLIIDFFNQYVDCHGFCPQGILLCEFQTVRILLQLDLDARKKCRMPLQDLVLFLCSFLTYRQSNLLFLYFRRFFRGNSCLFGIKA